MKNHMTLLHFGRNVRRLRLEAGLAQDDVALRCTRSIEQIAQIEAGSANPTLAVIEALAQALGVDASTLLQGLPSVGHGSPGRHSE